jgi:hypothetical protein
MLGIQAPALLQYWVLAHCASVVQGSHLFTTQIWPPLQSAALQQSPPVHTPPQQT